jgi:hypothetical protein
MVINQLPPQAYTKETLARAYEWLRHQSPAVREMATSAEILIGLYTRAQRHGEEVLERPSIQNFKSELKSIAGMMGEFTEQKSSPPPKAPAPETFYQSPPPPLPPPVDPIENLDMKSKSMIHEVKNQLNLSSDSEALRLLVSLGFHRARVLWSKPE